MKKCDIIIPIYNAYDAVKECIKTVINNTNLKENRLILINDKSTDERILPLLNSFKEENADKNIIVLANENNLGFVGTVNKGMKYSDNDVLLLNSDTEVPRNWLENMKKCAYSGEKIATVTALSNNATLASVPKGLERNEIPQNISFEEYAQEVERCSYCDFPELPTAHGFCMYIKREILNIVGYFDEESFGKGYGEENDFSFRCLDYGYRNLLCDNVIVYHKESQSFNEKRERLCQEHEKILNERYPIYESKLKEWCQRFPIKYIGNNILYSTNLSKKKNILILIHEWETSTGGTTLHVKDIVNGLRKDFNFHILSYKDGVYKLYSYFEDSECIVKLKSIKKLSILPRYNNEYKEMISDIIEGLGITDIHIHHMINHYFDVIDVIKKYKLSATISLHDFYSICPTINMLYEGSTYCDNLENKNCKNCLSLAFKINNNILDDWHNDWKRLFANVQNVITPSEDTKRRINKIYPEVNIKVIEHGINIKKSDNKIMLNPNKFNIAYVGVLSNHKGLKIFEKLINNTKEKNVKYHLFGISEDKKLNKSKKNYIYHGKYNRDNIAKLLNENNINLVCFFQICPETFSYTVSEVIASGVPILTYDIGAGSDRVKKYNLGWTIDLDNDANNIMNKINEIRSNPIEYNEKIKAIQKYKIKNLEEMNLEYKEIYTSKKDKKEYSSNKLKKILKSENLCNGNYANDELEAILNSTKWKLINKISFSPRTTNIIRKIIRRKV